MVWSTTRRHRELARLRCIANWSGSPSPNHKWPSAVAANKCRSRVRHFGRFYASVYRSSWCGVVSLACEQQAAVDVDAAETQHRRTSCAESYLLWLSARLQTAHAAMVNRSAAKKAAEQAARSRRRLVPCLPLRPQVCARALCSAPWRSLRMLSCPRRTACTPVPSGARGGAPRCVIWGRHARGTHARRYGTIDPCFT